FLNTTLSTVNYDALLIGWDAQALQAGVDFHGGNANFCLGEAARTNMIDNDGWMIADAGLDPNCVNDIIFKNSFEIPVTMFTATAKQFVFDFSLLESIELDNYPHLIAIGLNSEQEQTIKVHIRQLNWQLQIRMKHFYQDEFEDYWATDEWQDIYNTKMTTVSW
ncbi:hypothetical protein MNBD_GAMMA03-861, partial [hydrothermal vent metagenome]